MKGKVNLKTIIIFAILILVIVLLVLGVNVAKTFMGGAAAGYEPQNLTALPKEDGKSAIVTWTTDKDVKASVFYGTNMASLLLMAEDAEPTSSHNILLTNLKSNTSYYYKVVVDNDNIFDNGGVMYNFKTGGKTEEVMVLEPTATMALKPVVTLPVAASSSSSTSLATSSAATTVVCDRSTDYNKDGVINSLDYVSCLRGKVTVTPTAENKCVGDYNKDGVINSLDRIKCLQDSKI